MPATLEISALTSLQAKLSQIQLKNIDATDLMQSWSKIMEEDNRTGILAGLDKDGVPMVPVFYRPKAPPGLRVTRPPKSGSMRAELTRFRRGQLARAKKGVLAGITGIGPDMVERNNNLTTKQYQLLAGPPLAPRDQFSRVITNYLQEVVPPTSGEAQWALEGVWEEVVDIKGRPFLHYHFNGIGQVRRDLRGLRPQGIEKASKALSAWARLKVREYFG